MEYKKNDICEIAITSLGASGEGVGTIEGFTVFIEGALPGETVKAKLTVLKKNYGKGELLEILKKSEDRVIPVCPLFDRCGGCQIMHLSYEGQLKVKKQKVYDALTRIGKLTDITVEDCVPSPQKLHYRNKMQLPVTSTEGALTIGLFEKMSHTVVPVDECHIHCEEGEKVYKNICTLLQKSDILPYDRISGKGELRHLIMKTAVNSGKTLVIFVSAGEKTEKFKSLAAELIKISPNIEGIVLNIHREQTNFVTGHKWMTLFGEGRLSETICGLHFHISPASFFQVNTLQAENLYKAVTECADIDAETSVLDAYCGVGTFSLIAAAKAKKVVGIECVPEAIADAKENAKNNGITNCTFVCGTTEELIKAHSSCDVVILNPPRKGCEKIVLETLLKTEPKRIVYVSCDPATLARDLALLTPKYTIEAIRPFDMFPQTMHVETVVKLVLRRN